MMMVVFPPGSLLELQKLLIILGQVPAREKKREIEYQMLQLGEREKLHHLLVEKVNVNVIVANLMSNFII